MNVNWTGYSGRVYGMELCELGRAFATNPGVYLFCKPAAKGKWTQIYVGETEDFNDCLNVNLANHPCWECIILREQATNICCFVLHGGKVVRTAIETDLKVALRPPCNCP